MLADHGLTPVGFVNDFANMLSPQARLNTEQELQNFEKQTGNQIAVVSINSLGGDSVENYAAWLFEEWKIG